jgi:hypothetical protein
MNCEVVTRWLSIEGVAPKNPMIGSLPGCCARPASDHAAAPLSVSQFCRKTQPGSNFSYLLLFVTLCRNVIGATS